MTLEDAISLIDHPALRGHLAKPPARGQGHEVAGGQGRGQAPVRWADLGCGSGLFTVALAHFLARGSIIDAIDLHPGIEPQTTKNGVAIRPHSADFTRDDLPFAETDGVIMANSLHYVRDKAAFLTRISHVPALLLVEYDTDVAVPRWVPYPLSLSTASAMLRAAGRANIQKLGSRPSSFGRSDLYAALAFV